MKVCIAQTKSVKGAVVKNIAQHVTFVERAVALKADLIIFPELSITNYEPGLAKSLATDSNDPLFKPFQKLSNRNKISIGVGMPTRVKEDIRISMLIFQPDKEPCIYSKQMLHSDELPYFVGGDKQTYLNIKGCRIALGICYETLQREHFIHAFNNNIDLYIASVAKPKGGVEKAVHHFQKLAKEFQIPILMSNCVGKCDNFESVGQSAVWGKNGNLLITLDDGHEGLIIYDTQTTETYKEQLLIEKGKLSELDTIFQMYLNGKKALESSGLFQWTNKYPTRSLIEDDLKKQLLYVLKNDQEIIGAINLSEEQEAEYQSVDWKFDDSKVLVIHRLVIEPAFQRNGHARKLMDFAEQFAQKHKYTSIRLDAYSANARVVNFYKQRNYKIRGDVTFPEREYPFHCMEKEVLIT